MTPKRVRHFQMTRRRDDKDDEGASHRDESACPFHSGHEELLASLEDQIEELKEYRKDNDERMQRMDTALTKITTTVKVGVAVMVSVASGSVVVIGLLIAWMK